MPSRRSRYDPLGTSDRPRWLVVKDVHSQVIECREVPAGADLHALITATVRARQADGWTVENDGSYGFVFCRKADVRRMVAIVQVDPAQPAVGTYPAPPAPA